MKYSKFILIVLFALSLSACNQVPEEIKAEEIGAEPAVESEAESESEEIQSTEMSPLVLETMADYYFQLPDEYFPVKKVNRKELDIQIQDETNYYLYAEPTYLYPKLPVTLTLFLRDGNPLVAVHFNEDKEEKVYFLEYQEDSWVDHTEEVLSTIDWDYLLEELGLDENMIYFTLPQVGTAIRGDVAGKEVFALEWKKGQFQIAYALGDRAAGSFLYSAGEFSFEFPQRWSEVVAVHDFGGFGSSEAAPMCTVCGHVASFGFTSNDDFLLFNVTYFSKDFKGSSEIPSKYQWIGEGDCTVYYAAPNEGVPLEYRPFLSDLPEIYESFELTGESCSEE